MWNKTGHDARMLLHRWSYFILLSKMLCAWCVASRAHCPHILIDFRRISAFRFLRSICQKRFVFKLIYLRSINIQNEIVIGWDWKTWERLWAGMRAGLTGKDRQPKVFCPLKKVNDYDLREDQMNIDGHGRHFMFAQRRCSKHEPTGIYSTVPSPLESERCDVSDSHSNTWTIFVCNLWKWKITYFQQS